TYHSDTGAPAPAHFIKSHRSLPSTVEVDSWRDCGVSQCRDLANDRAADESVDLSCGITCRVARRAEVLIRSKPECVMHPTPSPSNSSTSGLSTLREDQVERDFCRDFTCCGLVLTDLHDLMRHCSDAHWSVMSPLVTASVAGVDPVAEGLDMETDALITASLKQPALDAGLIADAGEVDAVEEDVLETLMNVEADEVGESVGVSASFAMEDAQPILDPGMMLDDSDSFLFSNLGLSPELGFLTAEDPVLAGDLDVATPTADLASTSPPKTVSLADIYRESVTTASTTVYPTTASPYSSTAWSSDSDLDSDFDADLDGATFDITSPTLQAEARLAFEAMDIRGGLDVEGSGRPRAFSFGSNTGDQYRGGLGKKGARPASQVTGMQTRRRSSIALRSTSAPVMEERLPILKGAELLKYPTSANPSKDRLERRAMAAAARMARATKRMRVESGPAAGSDFGDYDLAEEQH
ncbi:hypothetical protein HK101_005658, partial [Irineochytrium annulatum]